MTNKELFAKLNKEQQFQLVKTLACYDEAHIEFKNGKYHVETSITIRAKYEEDFEVLNTFKSKEFYPNGSNYHSDWYDFLDEKERNCEKNKTYIINGKVHGKFQDEFEKSYESKYQEAISYFLNK